MELIKHQACSQGQSELSCGGGGASGGCACDCGLVTQTQTFGDIFLPGWRCEQERRKRPQARFKGGGSSGTGGCTGCCCCCFTPVTSNVHPAAPLRPAHLRSHELKRFRDTRSFLGSAQRLPLLPRQRLYAFIRIRLLSLFSFTGELQLWKPL